MSDKINKPNIFFCSNCVYPSSSAVTLDFDKNFVCSGCQTSKEKNEIDWNERKNELIELTDEYKNADSYDCIIPVSGGKDSYFQTHVIKNELKLNPLLVTYNGNNYSKVGLENLYNMREKFNVDHIFFSPSISVLKVLNRLGMIVLGDMNWHAHAGIFTYPIRVSVDQKIPLMIWGEHGRSDVGGMYSHNDYIEFTYRHRHEHCCRGYEWSDFLEIAKKYNEKINAKQLQAWKYPSDEDIASVGTRGIYISNYIKWEANEHFELVKKEFNFKESEEDFERTYRKMSNLDDIHENGIHDYLKFVKFGYGRCSDHASKDIRAGKISRDEAIEEVKKRDSILSKDVNRWLKYVGWDLVQFNTIADSFRDPRVWWIKNNKWYKQNIWGGESDYGNVFLSDQQKSKFYRE